MPAPEDGLVDRLVRRLRAEWRAHAGQDLLLASNAHTNHDLPYAYAAAGLLTQRGESRKPDHDGVNDVNATAELITSGAQPGYREVRDRHCRAATGARR